MDEVNSNHNKNTRICPYCRSSYEIEPGIRNFKNLFRKPTWNEWFLLIMIIFCIVLGMMYFSETKECRDFINNIDQVCTNYNLKVITPNVTYIKQSPILVISPKEVNKLSLVLLDLQKKIDSMNLLPNGERENK